MEKITLGIEVSEAKAAGIQWMCMGEFHFFRDLPYDQGRPRCPYCSAGHFIDIDDVVRFLEMGSPMRPAA